ncbi:hypothetical protein [Curtobacterium sp. MCBA15_004]|uniref:hypothetical protein n=1 Tax=unclassified Curtobacterium TaxID=257496 RepID=UPI0008DCDCE7|nr:hypothetical protein [Curtobacterium sp. MCBA15_004]WIA95663.1 hypothetical protein QOL16_11060 [Curtobacterium sp. MCBA15_004]
MSRSRRVPVRTVPIVAALGLGLALSLGLAACTEGGDPAPSRSAGQSPDGSATDATGPDATATSGTGNGSGVEHPDEVDFSKVAAQGVAAAGGGTVVSIAGSGDSWTVVVVGPDGSQTQSVVSAVLDRVTSGPFPKQVDAAAQASTVALAAAVQTGAGPAAAAAEAAVPGSELRSLVLGGSTAAPVWTATVADGSATSTVSVDGTTGTATVG